MDLDPQAVRAGAAGLILWGLLDCFFGYRVFKFTVALLGAAAGAVLGHQLFVEVLGLTGDVRWIGLAVGAVIGGVLAFGLYLVGIFILGFSLGFMLAPGLWPAADKPMLLVVGAVAGLVCGVVATLLQRLLVAVGTAWSGSIRVVLGVAFFTDGLDWSYYAVHPQEIGVLLTQRMWMLLAFFALGASGFIAQLMGHRRAKATSKES